MNYVFRSGPKKGSIVIHLGEHNMIIISEMSKWPRSFSLASILLTIYLPSIEC